MLKVAKHHTTLDKLQSFTRTFATMMMVVLVFSKPAFADLSPRLITVTGEADVMVVPDEVHVNLQVESFDTELSKAKAANDSAIKQALEIIRKYKIDDKDFRTDFFTVRNGDNYYMDPQTNQQRQKRGFFVTKNVSIILRDVSKFEALYSDALEAGINNIYGVEFQTSKLKEHQNEARVLAINDAKEKAIKLSGELGQEISRPYSIQENVQSDYTPRPMMGRAMIGGAEANPTIALGQIKINASVTVSFELK